jgi:N-acetylmuramoyl-L-alanine amidase-like protein
VSRAFVTAWVAVAVVAAFGLGTIVAPTEKQAPDPTVTVPVDGLDPGRAPDRTVQVPRKIVQDVAPTVEDQLRTPPPATPQGTLQDAQKAADENRRTTTPLPTAGATAGFQGCRTSFVRNQSSRRGVRPVWQVLHYTVSPNRPGWSDVNAVVALFDRTSSQASSNFVIDGEGHCAYIVPVEAKAWTQAAGNPFSVSYEIIATGKERTYLAPAGLAKLRAVSHEVARRTGIPLRRGSNNGCSPGRSGFLQHADFGLCGGGHVDVKPFNANAIIATLVTGSKPVTSVDRATCRKLNWWRKAGRPTGQAERNAVRRKAALSKRGVRCLPSGPVRR